MKDYFQSVQEWYKNKIMANPKKKYCKVHSAFYTPYLKYKNC